MRTAGKLILFAQQIIYKLLLDFNVDASAPLPSLYSEGTGSVNITDTGNKLTKAGGHLVSAGMTTIDTDPLVASTISYPRKPGLAFTGWHYHTTTNARVNYGLNATLAFPLDNTIAFRGATLRRSENTFSVDLPLTLANATGYNFAIVLFATGMALFVDRKLYWIEDIHNEANVYAVMCVDNVNAGWEEDHWKVYNVGFPLTAAANFATVNVTASSGVAQTADAEGTYELAFTLPAGSANLVAAELRYRYQDASNYWTAYVKRNAGNTQWDFYLDKVTAGTPATQAGFPVTNVGTLIKIRVETIAARHNCYTRVGTLWAKRGGEISDAAFQTQTSVMPIAGAGTTLGALMCWPYSSPTYSVLPNF